MKRFLTLATAAVGLAAAAATISHAQTPTQSPAQSRDSIEEPAHEIIARGEGFELRDYQPMIVAEVSIEGERRRATSAGFRRLAAYIFAQDRPLAGERQDQGEKIAMTSPVLQDQKIAMTAPVLQDSPADAASSVWRTRFVMPASYTMESLPTPPKDITLTEIPARRMAAVLFNGYGERDDLALMESMLRGWIKEQGYTVSGEVEYAFYDGPWVSGPFRRNEVMLPVEEALSTDP